MNAYVNRITFNNPSDGVYFFGPNPGDVSGISTGIPSFETFEAAAKSAVSRKNYYPDVRVIETMNLMTGEVHVW